MPKQNKTGPKGKGPLTGRGFGPCKKLGQKFGDRFKKGLGRLRGKKKK